jgi:hypothetical protein
MSTFVSYNKEKVIVNNKVLKDDEYIMKNEGDKFIVENLKDGTVNIGYKVEDELMKNVFNVHKQEGPLIERLKSDIKSMSKKMSKPKMPSKKGKKGKKTRKKKGQRVGVKTQKNSKKNKRK